MDRIQSISHDRNYRKQVRASATVSGEAEICKKLRLQNLHSMTNGGPALTKSVPKLLNALNGPVRFCWDKLSERWFKKCLNAKEAANWVNQSKFQGNKRNKTCLKKHRWNDSLLVRSHRCRIHFRLRCFPGIRLWPGWIKN